MPVGGQTTELAIGVQRCKEPVWLTVLEAEDRDEAEPDKEGQENQTEKEICARSLFQGSISHSGVHFVVISLENG